MRHLIIHGIQLLRHVWSIVHRHRVVHAEQRSSSHTVHSSSFAKFRLVEINVSCFCILKLCLFATWWTNCLICLLLVYVAITLVWVFLIGLFFVVLCLDGSWLFNNWYAFDIYFLLALLFFFLERGGGLLSMTYVDGFGCCSLFTNQAVWQDISSYRFGWGVICARCDIGTPW